MSLAPPTQGAASTRGRQPLIGWAVLPALVVAVWGIADVVVGRSPGWPEAVVCVLTLGALVWSAADLRSHGFVRAVTRGSGQRAEVALTFDDGPDPDPAATRAVLSALGAFGAQATFFLIGEKAEQHPELVREIRAAGHELGSHGFVHRWQAIATPRRACDNVRRAVAAIAQAAGGESPRYFRPPYGVATPALRQALATLGMPAVGWSVRPFDARGRGDPTRRAQWILDRLRPGDIVLLHDAPERPGRPLPLGPALLPSLLAGMQARGLRAVSLTRLLE